MNKIFSWLLWIGGILLILLLLLTGFASWYISSEQAQNEIRLIVLEQTGNTVTFDRVGLSLVLRPHLTFRHVTITVPDATTGLIESANLYPQLWPLLMGTFRIAALRAVSPSFIVPLSEHVSDDQDRITFGKVKKDMASVLDVMRAISANLVIEVKQGRLIFRKRTRDVFTVQNIRGSVELIAQGFDLDVRGDTDQFGPSSMRGRFFMEGNRLVAKSVKATVLDSSITSSVVLGDAAGGLHLIDISAEGSIGRKTIQWTSNVLNLPPEQIVRAPLSLSDARFIWNAPSDISLAGTISLQNGPSISFQAHRNPNELRISKLIIQDQESMGSLTCLYTNKILDFSFRGSLREHTLNKIFEHTSFHRGSIRGDFQAHIVPNRIQESTAQGSLEGSNFILSLGKDVQIKVEELGLSADQKNVNVRAGSFTWADTHFSLKGSLRASTDGIHVDIDLASDGIKVEDIQQAVAAIEKENNDALDNKTARPVHYPPAFGIVRFNSKYISYGRYTANPVRADMMLGQKGFHVTILDAAVCGISLPGSVTKIEDEIQLDFKPTALQQPLEATLSCLGGADKTRITGTFDVHGRLRSRGKSEDLLRALHGRVTFVSHAGDIYRYTLLSRVFDAISIPEMVLGKFPNMEREGFAYETITIKCTVKDGKLELQEAIIDSHTANIIGQGEIDITNNTLSLTVLVAPFRTVDFVIRNIPLVNTVLNNTLITFPVKVTGVLGNPRVTAISPTAIGEGFLGIINRTLKLPYTLVEPLIPQEKPDY
jgi:AsmA-like C-terminal region